MTAAVGSDLQGQLLLVVMLSPLVAALLSGLLLWRYRRQTREPQLPCAHPSGAKNDGPMMRSPDPYKIL
jgi:uncharacterized iron-regulated membrane protein